MISITGSIPATAQWSISGYILTKDEDEDEWAKEVGAVCSPTQYLGRRQLH
jgi:hypothetical protein